MYDLVRDAIEDIKQLSSGEDPVSYLGQHEYVGTRQGKVYRVNARGDFIQMIGGSKAGGQEVKWTDGEIAVFDKGNIKYGNSEAEIKETVSQAIKIDETRIILNSVSHKGYVWNKN